MEISLRRDPERMYRKIIILLAEGIGFVSLDMCQKVSELWRQDGEREDWLFIVTGGKEIESVKQRNSLFQGQVPWMVHVRDNFTNCRKALPTNKECGYLAYELINRGVPAEQLLYEDISLCVFDQTNVVGALLMTAATSKTIGNFPQTRLPVTLVCNDLHVGRAARLFNAFGYKVEDSWTVEYTRCPNAFPWWYRLPRLIYWLLEVVASFRDRCKGHFKSVS